MNASTADTIMSTFATIALLLLVFTCAIWVLSIGVKIAGKRTLLFSDIASTGHSTEATHSSMTRRADLFTFLFDRSLPAAAASGARKVARESVISANGEITINLTSPSPREIEICLVARDVPPGSIAVVHVMDESGSHIQLIPLVIGSFEAITGYYSGIAMVPTTARAVEIGRDVKLIEEADLDTLSPTEITRSVGSATGPTRRWWQELLRAAETGEITLMEATISAIAAAITNTP